MKKTFIFTAVAAALSMPFTVAAEDSLNGVDDLAVVDNGAVSIGALSPATNKPVDSYVNSNSHSDNFKSLDTFNEINSDNSVAIGRDGNVIYGNQVDQAVAASDLAAIISGNDVIIDSVHNALSPLSPAANTQTNNKRQNTNTIGLAFSGASGIAILSQNTGHASSIQQSTVVQSNFNLR